MEWYETEERLRFAQTADRYAKRVLEIMDPGKLNERATPEQFNWELIRQADQAGLLNAPLPENLGGVNLDGLGQIMVLERMAQAAAGVATIFALHWTGLSAWGSLSGQALQGQNSLCGLALPASVIDSTGRGFLETKKSGPGLALSGEFICPLHPALVESILVAVPEANGGPMILRLDGKGLVRDGKEAFPGSGLLEIPLARLVLDGFQAPAKAILAEGEKAQELMALIRRNLYASLASVMVGNARAAAVYAWEYGRERVQTGRLIIEHQDVRRVLERMSMLVEAAAGALVSAVSGGNLETAPDRIRHAYMFAGAACEEVCLDAIQCLGGYGYMEDYPLERRLRDLKTIQGLLGSHVLEWIGESF